MPAHVQNGRSGKFGGHEALVECGGCTDLRHQRIRNHFSALIMTGVCGKHLRLKRPVFVELGREFHKVAGYACAADILVGTLAEKAVKGMTELVEHCGCLVEGQK